MIISVDAEQIFDNTQHRASLIAQLVKNPPAMQETWVQSLGWKIPWRRESLPTPVFWSGEFHGLYNPWGPKELDTIECFHFHESINHKKVELTILIHPKDIITLNVYLLNKRASKYRTGRQN